jgi:hypothetical protein
LLGQHRFSSRNMSLEFCRKTLILLMRLCCARIFAVVTVYR